MENSWTYRVDVLKFLTFIAFHKRSRIIVQSQIRLLLKKQLDQGLLLNCYPDNQHFIIYVRKEKEVSKI